MKFEDAGRTVDQEIQKILEFLQQRAKPAARRDTAAFLRKAAERLAKLAEKLETPEQ